MERFEIKLPPEVARRLKNGGISKQISWIDRQKQRVEKANQVPGAMVGYDCPVCLNRGCIYVLDDEGYIHTNECQCMIQRRNKRRIMQSGLGELLQRCTFQSWQTGSQWREQARRDAQRFAAVPNGWFLASGSVGTGKTHLCTAICGELMKRNMDVQYMLWRDVAARAKAVVNEDAEYQAILTPLKRVPVLYIDDLFKTGKGQFPTVGDVNLAFELLNARYNDRKKITIISTEWTVEGLLNIDEAVGSRIYERSRGNCLDFSGRENWRMR